MRIPLSAHSSKMLHQSQRNNRRLFCSRLYSLFSNPVWCRHKIADFIPQPFAQIFHKMPLVLLPDPHSTLQTPSLPPWCRYFYIPSFGYDPSCPSDFTPKPVLEVAIYGYLNELCCIKYQTVIPLKPSNAPPGVWPQAA